MLPQLRPNWDQNIVANPQLLQAFETWPEPACREACRNRVKSNGGPMGAQKKKQMVCYQKWPTQSCNFYAPSPNTDYIDGDRTA